MSNKPKGVKRLEELKPNKKTRRHIALVREARKQSYKNPGSKKLKTLLHIVPMKIINKFMNMFK